MEIMLLILVFVVAINCLTVAGAARRGQRRDRALPRYPDRYRSRRRWA